MKKKFLSLVLALAMTLSLVACGGGNTAKPSGDDAGGTFKLGAIGPLTGGAAIYGQAVINGVQIAVDEINASDSEIKFEYKYADDVHDPETSVNAYNTLMDWGMQVLAGPTTTGPSTAVATKCFEERTFMLTPSGSGDDIIKDKDNIFQVCFTDTNQGTAAANYINENMGGKTVAVIYQNDIAYSQGIRDTFKAEADAHGMDIVYEGTFTADTATDFNVQLTEAKNANAEILFLPIYYNEASILLAQASQMGYDPTFFGVDGMDGILTTENFDTSLAEGVMLLTPFSADAEDEKTQNFVKTYQEKYKETPNQFAADAYDSVYIIKAALEAAGCTADMSTEDICEALVGVMTTISVDGVTGQGMTWSENGAVSKAPMAVVIENGVYVLP